MRHRARVKRMVGIPGGGTTNLGLAAAVYNGKLFLFGVSAFAGGVGSEFVNVFDGAQWSGWSAVPGGGITNLGLTAAVFNGKLYLFGISAFQGGGTGSEFVNVFDGVHWSGWSPVLGGGTTNVALSATVFNGKLYLFGVSAFPAGGAGGEFVNVFDGAQWSGWSALPGAGTTNTGLAATVFNGKLYLFGVGAFPGGGAGGEFVNVFDGAHWSGWSPVAGGGTTNTGLAAAVHKNKLCLFGVGAFHGAGSAGEFLNSFDGAKSSGWSAVPDAGSTNVSLSSAESGGRLYVFGVSAFQGGAGGEFVNTMD